MKIVQKHCFQHKKPDMAPQKQTVMAPTFPLTTNTP